MDVGFDKVYVLQNPVVFEVSEVISTYIYSIGLERGQFSLTTAIGFFESFVGLILVLAANQLARRYNHELF